MSTSTNESSSSPQISKLDEWFTKWHLPDISKLTLEDAKKALEELEKIVENWP
jgi:hypothetical protein